MNQLHDTLDKLYTEVDHLERIVGEDDLTHDEATLALSTAKRVRRQSSLLVRVLASRRDDTATAQEGTSA